MFYKKSKNYSDQYYCIYSYKVSRNTRNGRQAIRAGFKLWCWSRNTVSTAGFDYYHGAKYGYRYLIVTVEARNIGKREVYIDPTNFVVTDENNYFYEPEGGMFGAGIENSLSFTKILPNQRVRGKLVFEIPEKAKVLINYNFGDMFSKPFIVSWKVD